MSKPLFTGACTALVTPFLGENVNYPMLEQLLRRQLEAHLPAVVVCGTTGEAASLTDAEKAAIVRRAKEYVRGRCLIIAGTGSNDTEHACALSVRAEQAGADALLVVTPYYNKTTPEGLLLHYTAIAHMVHIPIILYNVPSRTGVDMPVSVCRELAKLPNIAGIKEAGTDIGKLAQLRAECPPDFAIWCGNDDRIAAAMALGCAGAISVVSNLYPDAVQAMTEAALDGDFDTASDLQFKLLPLIHALFAEVSPIPVKAAMRRLGYDCGACRLPLSAPSAETLETLARLIPQE